MALALADEVRLNNATLITCYGKLTIDDFNVTNLYKMLPKCYISIYVNVTLTST